MHRTYCNLISGCFFTLARSVLLEEKPGFWICHEKCWIAFRFALSIILGIIAYGSLIPALFWSLLWKAITLALPDEVLADVLDKED